MVKPRLHVSVNLLFGGWPPSYVTPPSSPSRPLTRPRAITLAMITMRKSVHGFPLVSYMGIGLRLVALRAAGALLQGLLENLNGMCVTEVIDQNIQKHEFHCLCHFLKIPYELVKQKFSCNHQKDIAIKSQYSTAMKRHKANMHALNC